LPPTFSEGVRPEADLRCTDLQKPGGESPGKRKLTKRSKKARQPCLKKTSGTDPGY